MFPDKYLSFADTTVHMLAAADLADWSTAFALQVDTAKQLGLMPADPKVTREVLKKYGFVPQNSHLEKLLPDDVLKHVGTTGAPALVFMQLRHPTSFDGTMVGYRLDESGTAQLLPGCSAMPFCQVQHVWLRWNDGMDRSPFPRQKRTSKLANTTPRDIGNVYYAPYQPNPRLHNIGDCVVRALTGVMQISWNEALDLLTSSGYLKFNFQPIYEPLLLKQGFVRHEPIRRNGRLLTGKEFCEEMTRTCHRGERIFAHSGRAHAIAVIPCRDPFDHSPYYSIVDSWDSTNRPITTYWSKCKKPSRPLSTRDLSNLPLEIGSVIVHPSYGNGTIVAMTGEMLEIDFGEHGFRRLGRTWVLKKCSTSA